MDYKIEVGMYVETINHEVGYITTIICDKFYWFNITRDMICHSKDIPFTRVGTYDCTKKNKIEELRVGFAKEIIPATVTTVDTEGNITFEFNKMTESYKKIPPTNEQIVDKLNEIIDYINKENE